MCYNIFEGMLLMNPDYLSAVDSRFSKMFLCNL